MDFFSRRGTKFDILCGEDEENEDDKSRLLSVFIKLILHLPAMYVCVDMMWSKDIPVIQTDVVR